MASTDARPVPIRATAYRVVFSLLDADGDLVTGATGLDSEVSKDQGTFVDCTNEATEIATASGVYYLDLSAAEMTADCVAVIVKTTTTGAKTTVLVFYPQEAGDIRVTLDAVTHTGATVPTVTTVGTLTTYTGNTVQTGDSFARIGATGSGLTSLAPSASALSTTQWTGARAGYLDSLNGNVAQTGDAFARIGATGSGLTSLASQASVNTVGGYLDTEVAAILAAVDTEVGAIKTKTDQLTFTVANVLDANTTYILGVAATTDDGTATAGGASTITLAAGSSAVNDHYKNRAITLVAGTGVGQSRYITGYVGSTRVATVDTAWTTAPDNTSKYLLGDTAATAGGSVSLGATAPAGWINTAAFAAGATIPRATLVDTLTTYTGNTVQTGDAFARIGATGSGLTSLASQASVTAVDDLVDTEVAAIKTDTAAIKLKTDNLPASPAAVGSNMGTVTSVTGSVGSVVGHTAQTGDSFARIGATGSGLTSLAPSATALSTAVWTGTKAGYLDAAISSVSTGGVSAEDIADAVWADAPAGTPVADIAGAVWAVELEAGVNARQGLAMIGAVVAGKASGAGTGTITYYAMGPGGTSTARLVASASAGNRTATTLTLPT